MAGWDWERFKKDDSVRVQLMSTWAHLYVHARARARAQTTDKTKALCDKRRHTGKSNKKTQHVERLRRSSVRTLSQ